MRTRTNKRAGSARKRLVVFACLVLLLAGLLVRADEVTRRAQEELRKRNLYFGDVNGQMNSELASALKKYQARKGFAETGQIDEETSHSLNIPYRTLAKEPTIVWPDVPVLKSDVARQLPEAERHALEQKAEQNAASSPRPPPPAEGPSAIQEIKPEETTKFVQAYLRDAETDNVDLQVGYYDFPVDYFDHGRVDRDFVFKDTHDYVKRWPQRKYTLLGPVKFFGSEKEDETKVEFTIAFSVAAEKRAVHGKTRNFWTVKRAGNLRIIAIKEQRLHE
jgi:peptidoglycan hydrolase-like protein with peptidoglycan-binding domain